MRFWHTCCLRVGEHHKSTFKKYQEQRVIPSAPVFLLDGNAVSAASDIELTNGLFVAARFIRAIT